MVLQRNSIACQIPSLSMKFTAILSSLVLVAVTIAAPLTISDGTDVDAYKYPVRKSVDGTNVDAYNYPVRKSTDTTDVDAYNYPVREIVDATNVDAYNYPVRKDATDVDADGFYLGYGDSKGLVSGSLKPSY